MQLPNQRVSLPNLVGNRSIAFRRRDGLIRGVYKSLPGAALDPAGLQGARIGVARNFRGFHPQVDRIFEDCLLALREAGAELTDPANIETAAKLDETELKVLLYEFKSDLIHPNAKGYARLAEAVAGVLKKSGAI